MDDMMEKLQAILSDPEAMQNLQELSAMLRESTDKEAPSPPPQDGPCDSTPPLPDFSRILALREVFSHTGDDRNINLLLALKPHLSRRRMERVDRAVKLLRIYSAASALKEQGMLDDLLAGL